MADLLKLQETAAIMLGKLFSLSNPLAIDLRKGTFSLGVNNQIISGPEDAVAMLRTMFEDGSQAELKVRRRARTYRIHLQDLQVR